MGACRRVVGLGCLVIGCQFGGTGDTGAVDGGLAKSETTADEPPGSTAADDGLTGIPTGVGAETGSASTGAVDGPGTWSDDGQTQGESTAAPGSTGGDTSTGAAEAGESSSSSGGVPVDDPYEDCAGALTGCYGGLGTCYDLGASVCVPFCEVGGTCPAPLSGTSVPVCGDFPEVDLPVCGLPCGQSSECPTGMACETIPLVGLMRCVWPL